MKKYLIEWTERYWTVVDASNKLEAESIAFNEFNYQMRQTHGIENLIISETDSNVTGIVAIDK